MRGITSQFVRLPVFSDQPVHYPKYMYLYKEIKGGT